MTEEQSEEQGACDARGTKLFHHKVEFDYPDGSKRVIEEGYYESDAYMLKCFDEQRRWVAAMAQAEGGGEGEGETDHDKMTAGAVLRRESEQMQDEAMQMNINRPMTVKEYNSRKKDILALLRRKGDPLPEANIAHGEFSSVETAMRIKEILKDPGNTYTLVRGYRLVIVMDDPVLFTYGCQSYLVLRNADGKLRCVTRGDRFQEHTFIFVPSSRMHPELSDDELISGKHQFATIISGSRCTVEAMRISKRNMSLFEKRTYALTPETAEVIPSAYVRYFPFFVDFLKRTKYAFETPADVAVCFGMPWRPLEDEDLDELDLATTKLNTVTAPTAVDAVEFISPVLPWRFDRDSWLPSVPSLHAILEGMYALENAIPQNIRLALLFQTYEQLGREYYARMEEAASRFTDEYSVLAEKSFA